jgi:16S rRNA (guanine966-N2)-methyltransferase
MHVSPAGVPRVIATIPRDGAGHGTAARLPVHELMSLRVIAGSAGGRRLVAPKGSARPTTDRLKEALFASLGGHRIDDASVLDLYAGSGALGIEALSRGAARAVFVDRDVAAEVAIFANLDTVGLADDARFQRSTVTAFLAAPVPEAPFDVVFLDPPYDMANAEVASVLAALDARELLASGSTVVVERPKLGDRPEFPEGWRIERERVYGDTLLLVAIA